MAIQSVEDLDALLASVDDDVLAEFATHLRQEFELRRLPPLHKLELFVTHRCNLRCDYCFLQGSGRRGDMPMKVAARSLEFLMKQSRERQDVHVTLFGGEPLLRKDLMEEILKSADRLCRDNDKKLTVSCTTNGLLLDERAVEISAKYKFLYLLSVDGPQDVHDRHRKTAAGKGTFDRLAKKIAFLKRYQGWLGTRMTIGPDAISSMARGVRELFELGINQFLIGLVTEVEWQPDQLAQIKEQYYELFDFYLDARDKNAPIRINAVEGDLFKTGKIDTFGCSAGTLGIAVGADGDVYPCSRLLRWNKYRMGNIMDGGVNWEIGKYLRDMRSEIRWKCLHCEYRDQCGGGCPETNLFASGSPYYPSEAQCAQAKAVADLIRENPRFERLADLGGQAGKQPAAESRQPETVWPS